MCAGGVLIVLIMMKRHMKYDPIILTQHRALLYVPGQNVSPALRRNLQCANATLIRYLQLDDFAIHE